MPLMPSITVDFSKDVVLCMGKSAGLASCHADIGPDHTDLAVCGAVLKMPGRT